MGLLQAQVLVGHRVICFPPDPPWGSSPLLEAILTSSPASTPPPNFLRHRHGTKASQAVDLRNRRVQCKEAGERGEV